MKKIDILKALRALFYRYMLPRQSICCLCEKTLYRFLPYQSGRYKEPALIIALDVVGSDIRQFECPWCGAHDRERHLYLYMQSMSLFSGLSNKKIIHFAPEKRLSTRIAQCQPKEYVRCDLFPKSSDIIRVDMLNMQFEDETFDLLIANHVMEHVSDEFQATEEIFRVLKPGGYAILQTPYSSKLNETWCDKGIDEDEMRLQAYGQEDHVRLYGRDIFTRFSTSGLCPKVCAHNEILTDYKSIKYGVNEREPFFLFQRPLD